MDDILTRFGAYAQDFEKTFVDDDWSRLRQYFADDAVYEVKGGGFACRLEGPERIFAGMKKSLDGFDRRLDSRTIGLTTPPAVRGDTVDVKDWTVTYVKNGKPPFVLRGSSECRYRDGRIAHLTDYYAPEIGAEFAAWQSANGLRLDGSYV
jgi:hypothetical protein